MPDVQSQICITFEVLDATLQDLADMSTSDHSDLVDACSTLLYGSDQPQVEALLSGPVANPLVPVSHRGMPELGDCWTLVLALIEAYNALATGLELVPDSNEPTAMPRPHCAEWKWIDGVLVLIVNWGVALTHGGHTDQLYRVSDAAGVSGQVLAMGHAAISVPIQPP